MVKKLGGKITNFLRKDAAAQPVAPRPGRAGRGSHRRLDPKPQGPLAGWEDFARTGRTRPPLPESLQVFQRRLLRAPQHFHLRSARGETPRRYRPDQHARFQGDHRLPLRPAAHGDQLAVRPAQAAPAQAPARHASRLPVRRRHGHVGLQLAPLSLRQSHAPLLRHPGLSERPHPSHHAGVVQAGLEGPHCRVAAAERRAVHRRRRHLGRGRPACPASFVTARGNYHIPPGYYEQMQRYGFEHLGLPPQTEPRERLYVSRKFGRSRRVLNEDELVEFLKPYGFTSVRRRRCPSRSRSTSTAAREIVAGVYGANWALNVYSGPIKNLVLYADRNPETYVYTFCKAIGQAHHFLTGESDDANADFHADLGAVQAGAGGRDGLATCLACVAYFFRQSRRARRNRLSVAGRWHRCAPRCRSARRVRRRASPKSRAGTRRQT